VHKKVLQKQVIELTEKSKDNEYIIKAKLQEKDEEITNMKEEMNMLQKAQREIMDLLNDPVKLIKVLNEK